jgi:cupin fold WbuC family metalloprotein
MLINQQLLDTLTAQAKSNPRLRQHYDLRNSPGDTSQRILNAMEPGTVLPIHRHRTSSETMVMLRGKGRWNYYDDNGNLTESFIISANDDITGISVPPGQWHNCESLESGTVILECKDGAWAPFADEDVLNINI